jgi:uncharacterized membrane protein
MPETEELEETAEEAEQDVGDQVGGDSVAKRVLIPAAAGVGTLAAMVAARKAPDLKDKLLNKLEQRGGEEAAEVGQEAASRLQGGGGLFGGMAGKAAETLSGGTSGGKTRRLPIQRWTDVAVPIDAAFEKWTDFEEFPKFMHRVLSVEQDDNHVRWQEKIWFSTRQWEGEITDQRKNDRIAWKTTEGMSHAGVVTFHSLDKNLTRIMVTMDFRPNGVIEKMASGLRFVKRAVQADLARFKAYVEMEDVEGVEYKSVAGSDEESEASKEEPQGSQNGSGESKEAQERSREESNKSREERAMRREQRRS